MSQQQMKIGQVVGLQEALDSAVADSWHGAWDGATSYVAGDMVERNGSSYVALASSLNNDPEAPPGAVYGGMVAEVDSTSAGSAGSGLGGRIAQAFVLAEAQTIRAVTAEFSAGVVTDSYTIGIATALGASPTFLASETVPGPTSASEVVVEFDQDLELSAGVTYYYVAILNHTGTIYHKAAGSNQTYVGLTTPEGMRFGATFGSVSAGYRTVFKLMEAVAQVDYWDLVASKGLSGDVTAIEQVTQATYDGLTPDATTLYLIVD